MQLLRETPFEVAFLVTPVAPPRPTLTVVVKATFTLPLEGTCAVAAEQLPVSGDAHVDDDPAKALVYEADLAPMKPRGECFVIGSCHPAGGAATASAVAFSVGPVKKRIAVFGDRRWGSWPFRAPGAPAAFAEMPLTWTRAFGGPGEPRNPAGRSGAEEPPPNLEDPDALLTAPGARATPVGCAPMPRTWPARARHAGTFDDAWQRDRWPYLPPDHDPAYHLAAPADQRIEGFWTGDEEITLRNLRPERELVKVRLPGVTARVFVVRREGAEPEAVRMRLDTITVDAATQRVLVLWRGTTSVTSDLLEDVRGLVVWHEPIGAKSDASHARARLDAAAAKDQVELAGFAPEPVPEAEQPEPELPPDEPLDPAVASTLAEVEALSREPDAPVPELGPEQVAQVLRDAGVPPDAVAEPPEPAEPAVDPSARERLVAALAAGAATADLDLTAADLSGLDLSGVDLSGCLLAGAVLTGARLDGAKLVRAVLAGATLTRASLAGADLTRADLTGARGDAVVLTSAVLRSAVLTSTVLPGAAMGGCRLDRAEARDATLDGADLSGAVLDGADLSGARLGGVRARGASLVGTSLEGARAAGIDLTGADLTKLRASEGAVLSGAMLREAKGAQGIYLGAALDGADLSYGAFARAEFSGADLTRARMDGCDLRGARALRAVLTGVLMRRADAMEANFEGADLGDGDLRGTSLYGAQLWKARVRGARFEGALLGGTLLATLASTLGASGGATR